MNVETQYWSHILDYDYRWLAYAESWNGTIFTSNMPPVMDPPPEQTYPRYDRYGRPVLRNPFGQIILPPTSGLIQHYHTTYFSAECAKKWWREPWLDNSTDPTTGLPGVDPTTGLPAGVVESGVASELMRDRETWPIPRGDIGKPLPAIATDGYLIGPLPPWAIAHDPAGASAGQKRARESASKSKSRSRSRGRSSRSSSKRREEAGQSSSGRRDTSHSSSRREEAGQSSLRRRETSHSSSRGEMTTRQGKQRESKRSRHD